MAATLEKLAAVGEMAAICEHISDTGYAPTSGVE